ncbi:MAG: hypothetical protein LBT45_02825 [Rickettsiales bacterium]|jgi:hypothetical protein|nr:hypothetical protein [Rickettsiales bacterium]
MPEAGPVRIANRPDPKVFALFRLRFAKCLLEIARSEELYTQKISDREFTPNFVQFLAVGQGATGIVRDDLVANYPHDAAELDVLLRTSDFFKADVPYRRIINLLYYGLQSPASASVLHSLAAKPCLEVLCDMKVSMLLSKFPDIYDMFVKDCIGELEKSGKFYPNLVKRGVSVAKWVYIVRGAGCISGFANLLKDDGLMSAFRAADDVSVLHRFQDRRIWPPAVVEYWKMFKKLEADIKDYIELYDKFYMKGLKRGNLRNVIVEHAGGLRNADMTIIEDMENMNRLTSVVARQILEWTRYGRLYAPAPFMPPVLARSAPHSVRWVRFGKIFSNHSDSR